MVVGCGIIIGLVVAYQNWIVAKAVTKMHPNEDFETTVIPGIFLSITAFASVFLQLIFRLFVYFNLTQNSSNLLSVKSVTLLIIAPFGAIMLSNLFPEFAGILTNFCLILKYFVVPLVILLSNEEAKTHFKLHNQGLLNMIPISWQLCQLLLTKLTQFIIFIKNIFCGPSNQIAPVEMIELQVVA